MINTKVKNEKKLNIRKSGVSGIMRVKNDAEFIEYSIESCIHALDELIIVYNDCSDDSPLIIEKMKKKYPEKIKVFEYQHKIFSVGLTKEEFEYVRELPEDSEHLLATYYNYALSKATFKYALKIDADQIYFSKTLQNLLDAYRGKIKASINIKNICSFLIILISLLQSKLFRVINSNVDYKKYFDGYKSLVLVLIKYFKIPVSLSGLNVFFKDEWYITMGGINDQLNILPPYNGVGDHIIFKISKRTRYIPDIQPSYCLMTSTKYSIIEKFVGISTALPFGFLWFHLNSMRVKIYDRQLNNFKTYPSKFINFKAFQERDYKDIVTKIPKILFSNRLKRLFNILHNGDIHSVSDLYLKIYKYSKDSSLRN